MWLISQRANAPPPPPRCKIHFPPNRRLKRSLSLLRILYLQSGCNGMIKFSFSFSFFFLLAPFFSSPLPQQSSIKDHGKGSSSVFLRSSGSRRGRRHRREKNPEEKVEGRKCCRFFKILSSASSSTLLHPLVSARGSLCQSFHGQEPVLETRSKPKATRIHIYITRRATDCHNGSRVTALPLLLPATLCHFGRSLDHSSGEGK